MNDADTPVETTVVGAGPAGVSAALWLHSYELPFRWLSTDGTIGGTLERVHNPLEDVLGATYPNGRALADDLRGQIEELELDGPEPLEVRSIERESGGRKGGFWRVRGDDEKIATKTVILATGTRERHLDIPGESEGIGEYVSHSTSRDAARYAGERVAVVGGGDAGFEGALQLARHDCEVHMLLKSDEHRARPLFVERVEAHPEIAIHPIPTIVERIVPRTNSGGCRLELRTREESDTLGVACLFVRIGVDPVMPDLEPKPETNDEGYVLVDRDQRTSVDRLYAAGEVTDSRPPSVAVSAGGGATAARSVAAALGWC